MKNFKLFSGLIILGIVLGYSLPYFKVNSFLVPIKAPKSTAEIDYTKLTLQNCAPRGELHGENWLGNDFIEALNAEFPHTKQVFQKEKIDEDSGINLYLRGYLQYSPPFPDHHHINAAYVIYPIYFSHYDKNKILQRDKLKTADYGYLQVFFDETQFYDVLFVASEKYTEKMKKAGYKAYYVPQFTNTKRFYPEYDERLKSEVLFVGSRPQTRKAPQILLKYPDIPLTVYGPESGGLSVAEYVNNNELHKYYSSAKIVLNDHRDDMRQYGFINNRTFDVTASGGFLISDYIPEIEEIYGDSIPMWKTEEELVQLVRYYLAPEHEAERREKAERARQITLKNFTVDKTAHKIHDIISELQKDKN